MRLLPLAALAGCEFSTSLTPARDAEIDAPTIDARPIDGAPGSARRRRITIPDAKVFATLTDFPVWLVIDDMPGLGAKATMAGNDIYFTRIDGTPLEHERVAWNKATGHLEAWVKVTLTDGGPSELDLRFGDPGPAHAPNAPAVWTSNFLAVWHMDDALGASTTVADARGVLMGTATNGPVSAPAGKLGKAIDFDGTNDEVTFVNPISGSVSSTFSAWVSVAEPADGFSSVVTVGNSMTNQSRFMHTNYPRFASGFFGQDLQPNTEVQTSQFTLLHWVYDDDANTTSMYRDGVLIVVANVTGTINTNGGGGHIGSAPAPWGPGGNTPNPVNGLLDEVRISNTARSAGWIRTEYENQSEPAAFYMLGPDLAVP